jgi:hypothetical protein
MDIDIDIYRYNIRLASVFCPGFWEEGNLVKSREAKKL